MRRGASFRRHVPTTGPADQGSRATVVSAVRAEGTLLGLLGGFPDRGEAALWGTVGVADAGLPTGQRGFVAEVEEEHARDVRLTGRELERPAVGGGLLLLGRGRRDLVAAVAGLFGFRDRGLDADLAVEDREVGPRLRGSVERGREQVHELAVVGETDRPHTRML